MIRVRFAPSPTGYLHLGSLRTFLFNWLFTRHNRGKIILRIEDTDQKRYVPGATESLIQTLKSLGLDWDEGPWLNEKNQIIEKGKLGPYFQTKRLDIYKNFAQKLIDQQKAYYCFCTENDLEKMRQEQIAKKLPPMYDERCRHLSQKEVSQKLKKGVPFVIRLKIPEQGIVKINDLIRGKIEFNYRDVDDTILIKSDGLPTYHLANVVDDYLMQITHVLRAEEWISSIPKHLFLYQSLGWRPPQMAHVPLILNPDHSKLSKRQGEIAVEDYLVKGYLPEALLNFIVLLGWNPGNNQEFFSLKELIKIFSIENIQKAGAVFNIEKLNWLNGVYVRQLKIDRLTKLCLPYLIQSNFIAWEKNKIKLRAINEKHNLTWLKKIIKLEQERLKRLNEITEKTQFFFVDNMDYEPSILIWKKTEPAVISQNLQLIKIEFKKISAKNFTATNIQKTLNKLGREKGIGEIFWPFRVALTGQQASPPPAEIAEILGQAKTISRLDQALDKLNKIL